MVFKEKVQSMTAKEIILAMVDGLENPLVRVNMDTYGYKDSQGFCFGCAATNTICKIGGIKDLKQLEFDDEDIEPDVPGILKRFNFPEDSVLRIWSLWEIPDAHEDSLFLRGFETAIDALRQGLIEEYNYYAGEHGFAQITPTTEIQPLHTKNYRQRLHQYKTLAENQP